MNDDISQFFGKRPFFDPRKLPAKFFETFVVWLTDSTLPLERGSRRQRTRTGPAPTEELFSLIRDAIQCCREFHFNEARFHYSCHFMYLSQFEI